MGTLTEQIATILKENGIAEGLKLGEMNKIIMRDYKGLIKAHQGQIIQKMAEMGLTQDLADVLQNVDDERFVQIIGQQTKPQALKNMFKDARLKMNANSLLTGRG